jgi:hypothetical protein
MNGNEAKARQIRLSEIKARIAELEAQLTEQWLELIDLRTKVAANHQLNPDHDYDHDAEE